MNVKVKERTVFELAGENDKDLITIEVDPEDGSRVLVVVTDDEDVAAISISHATWIALCDLRYRVQVKDPDERSCGTCYHSWRAGQQESHAADCSLKAEKMPRVVATGRPDIFQELAAPIMQAQAAALTDKSYWTGEKKAKEDADDVPF